MMAQSGRRWNPERAQRPDNISASAYNLTERENDDANADGAIRSGAAGDSDGRLGRH
jgi:hypothetical protein